MVLQHKKNKEGITKEIFAGDAGREGGREVGRESIHLLCCFFLFFLDRNPDPSFPRG
jgi:hypothetical protein